MLDVCGNFLPEIIWKNTKIGCLELFIGPGSIFMCYIVVFVSFLSTNTETNREKVHQNPYISSLGILFTNFK